MPCYLANIEKAENQEKSTQSVAVKAGYMIGEYGDRRARAQISSTTSTRSTTRTGPGDRGANHRLLVPPKGAKDAADAIQAVIDKNAKTADKDKMAGDAPLKQIMYRIRARAE